MIVDASAVLAVLRDEPDAAFFASALADRAAARRMSAANYLEAAIVIDSAKEPVARPGGGERHVFGGHLQRGVCGCESG